MELRTVHGLIQQWYQHQSEKIKNQSRATEFQESEKVTIYHHEIHKKSIRKLQTPGGVLEGHALCAAFLEQEVKNLLLTNADLDPTSQNTLLEELTPCFTEADNAILKSPPTLKSVRETIDASNLHAAPGCDGIPSLLYKVCWDTIGPSLTEVMQEVFKC